LASTSALLGLLSAPEGHYQVKLDPSARERFTIWMDTYAQRFGSFSAEQERRLEELRRACADLLTGTGSAGTSGVAIGGTFE
jgi:hypothetical protein